MTSLLPTIDAADRALLERAAAWPLHRSSEVLTRQTLADITRTHGIDFATALLYDRLAMSRDVTNNEYSAPSTPSSDSIGDVLIGVVPGAFYKECTFTGADGQRVLDAANRAGIRAERIPVGSFGTLKENARIVRDWVKQHPNDEICLVSLSKGGTDLQYALTEPGAADDFHNVSTWVNVSGIVQGTALANWLLGQWWRSMAIRVFAWWRRYPFDVLHEIKRDDNERLERALAWPPHLQIYHVIGFPLRRHMTNPWAQRAHRRLEARGPSDGGGILLADAVRWPGTIVPLWGADHYLQQAQFDVPALVLRLLDKHAACGVAHPCYAASGNGI